MAERETMSWDFCLANHVTKIKKDEERARSLLKMADLRYEFWSNIKVDSKYTSIIVDGYYEIIKELLTALLYLEGYKSDNHECLIAYLKEKYPDLAYEITVIYQLKRIRNDIDYKGFFVKQDYFDRNKIEFEHIIKTLKNIMKEKIVSG